MGRDRSTGARAVAALVLTAAVAFALVGTAAYVAAHRIARADALADALRTAHGVGTAVVEPELGPALDGDRAAAADLTTAVASRRGTARWRGSWCGAAAAWCSGPTTGR